MTTSGRQRRAACCKNAVVAAWFEYGVLSLCIDLALAWCPVEREELCVTIAMVWMCGLTVVHCHIAEIHLRQHLADREELRVGRTLLRLCGLTVARCRGAEIQLRQIWQRERSWALQEHWYSCVVWRWCGVVLQRYSYLWMHGGMTAPGGERKPVCYKSTVLLSKAESPAFDIDG